MVNVLPSEILDYLEIIETGKERACKEQKQLAAYIRRIFETEELFIDYDKINKYLALQKYFEFELFTWEIFLTVFLLCTFKKNGQPRWSELLVLCGRGTGKNGFLAFLAFCVISPANDIPYYFADICANSEDQAKTSFDDIYNILEDPRNKKKLEKYFTWTKEEIVCKQTRSKLKFRTNNPKGKDGLRSGIVFFDEIHAYENWDNINVFTTGLGKKPHPRKVYFTTNGDVREGPLDKLIEKSGKILNGEIEDNGFLPFICKLDDKEEVYDFKNWVKANPSLPYLPSLVEEMKREYADYVLDPNTHTAFMTKRMNLPQGRKDTEVASWENILKTKAELPNLTGCDCVAGIDFTKTTDFMSAFLLFKQQDKYYGIQHSWFCLNSNDKHRIKIPLDEMVHRGILTIVSDVEISAHLVGDWLREQKQLYNVKKIAVDSYRYSILSRALQSAGFDANRKEVKMIRPSDIMQIQPTINSLFLSGRLAVGDDPLFRWACNNTKLVPAQNNNFKYEKIEAKSRKNDMFMAFVAAMTIENELQEVTDFEMPEIFVF